MNLAMQGVGRRAAVFALAAWLCTVMALAGGKPTAELKFVVVKDSNGKPVRNASVILHPLDHSGKQEKGGLQLKTDEEGKTSIDGIPYGKVRVQVIATHFRTYGLDLDVAQASVELTIKLQPPQDQYSIYK